MFGRHISNTMMQVSKEMNTKAHKYAFILTPHYLADDGTDEGWEGITKVYESIRRAAVSEQAHKENPTEIRWPWHWWNELRFSDNSRLAIAADGRPRPLPLNWEGGIHDKEGNFNNGNGNGHFNGNGHHNGNGRKVNNKKAKHRRRK